MVEVCADCIPHGTEDEGDQEAPEPSGSGSYPEQQAREQASG